MAPRAEKKEGREHLGGQLAAGQRQPPEQVIVLPVKYLSNALVQLMSLDSSSLPLVMISPLSSPEAMQSL